MTNASPLNIEEIDNFTSKNPDWSFEDNKLKAKFEFGSFEEAIKIINEIATVCSKMDHHPLMTNVYNRLMFSIATHRAGDKVTQLDVELAKEISRIIKEAGN